jgi:hypothetical protein
VIACFQRKSVATSGMSPSFFDYIRVPCYSVFHRLGTFSHLTLRTRKPRSRFRLLGNVLSSKSLILQSLLVGGYNLLLSADSDTNFGRRRRGRQYLGLALCNCLLHIPSQSQSVYTFSDPTEHQETFPPAFLFADFTFSRAFPAGDMVRRVAKRYE